MTHSPSALHIRETEGTTIVTFRDRILLDTSEIRHIESELVRLAMETPHHRLIIDFNQVQAISSQLLGALVHTTEILQQRGGRLALCHVHAKLQEIFAITKLGRMFELYPDLNQGLAALKRMEPSR
ncbi:MAG: hypothetical protein HJJLKODD_00736 [Phycisphaerae bacterium]|nr:hypothetical protein [Phycisphaerae bacterium]